MHLFESAAFYLYPLALILLLTPQTLSPSFLMSCYLPQRTSATSTIAPLPLPRACCSIPLSPTAQEPSHYLPQACELGSNCAAGRERKVLYAAERS